MSFKATTASEEAEFRLAEALYEELREDRMAASDEYYGVHEKARDRTTMRLLAAGKKYFQETGDITLLRYARKGWDISSLKLDATVYNNALWHARNVVQ